MIRYVLSLAIFACFTITAVADIPPPPPAQGFKRVPYEHVLKLQVELPDYQFFPFQRLGLGGKETIGEELHLGTEKGASVPSSSSPSVRTGVVAVPKKVMDELKTKDNLATILSRDNKDKLPAGVVIHETFGTTRDLKASDKRTKIENVIIAAPDEKAGVKFSIQETPEPAVRDAAPKTSSRPPLGALIATLSMTLAIATLGVWVVRRKQSQVTPSES